jgi:hypothetical protein
MLKQAQQMQSRMEDMQKMLEAMEVEGQAGAGAVRVVLNGKGVLKSVRIDPALFASEEKDIVEDMIVAAHYEAKTIIDQKTKDEMAQMTGGLDLPPGMKLPF